MNYFVYNGVSSLDMGLRIESKNVFSAPEYDVTFQSIPGRNGDLILQGMVSASAKGSSVSA